MSAQRGRERRRSDTGLPPAVRSAAEALRLPLDSITATGGRTGQSWSCGEQILRVGDAEQLRREVAAMRAASLVVPVPEVYEVAEFTEANGRPSSALLLQRMPGRPAADTSQLSASQMHSIGAACGGLHRRLAAAVPTQELAPVHFVTEPAAPPSAPTVLHLDLHPLNVLVDEQGDVSGVVDWANAAVGPEMLDRARTWSILTFDPAVALLRENPVGAALIEGWSAAADWSDLPQAAIAWACDYMLNDLADHPSSAALRREVQLHRAAAVWS